MNNFNKIPFNYPKTEIKPVIDEIHGKAITDNYRWLEEFNSAKVKKWVEDQNCFVKGFLDNIREEESIKNRMEYLYQYEEIIQVKESKIGVFFLKKLINKQQPILYFQLRDKETDLKVVIDVNEINPLGLTSLDYFYPSYDGSFLVYGLSESGSEWATLYLLNMKTGEKLEEKIERAKWSIVNWKKDNSGFYYTRFPDPQDVPKGEEGFHQHIRYHEIGTNPKKDPIIFKYPDKPTEYPFPTLSPDETFMVIMIYRFVSNDLYIVDLTDKSPKITPMIIKSEWNIIPSIDKDYIYLLSNHQSSNYGLYRTKKNKPKIEEWECVIEPKDYILQYSLLSYDKITLLWLKDVSHKITIHDLDGRLITEVAIPKHGSIQSSGQMIISGDIYYETIFFNYQSFYVPPITYRYHIPSNNISVFFESDIELDSDNFKVNEVYYQSKDGTNVHMFIMSTKNCKLDGKNPTLLYGYGGFNISMTPVFSPIFLYWLEQKGVFAIANIRGGGEHGEDWHQSGILDKKQNVFDDFIAAGEYLIEKGYCSPNTLGIYGGSNGGLLVGAVMVQRPELFGAVYCSVPLLDMLRFHRLSIGKTWVPEYGTPDNIEDFEWLYAYSPYHNVNKEAKFPAIFFKTATNDSRVDPSHAFKMTALMQNEISSDNPILLQVDTEAGHGLGRSYSKLVNDSTTLLSFFTWKLIKK